MPEGCASSHFRDKDVNRSQDGWCGSSRLLHGDRGSSIVLARRIDEPMASRIDRILVDGRSGVQGNSTFGERCRDGA